MKSLSVVFVVPNLIKGHQENFGDETYWRTEGNSSFVYFIRRMHIMHENNGES
jgi:hypothetical protein